MSKLSRTEDGATGGRMVVSQDEASQMAVSQTVVASRPLILAPVSSANSIANAATHVESSLSFPAARATDVAFDVASQK